MRADRLVAILMLLQTRQQVTAAEVARELEVSEKTARRDLEALGVAGLPVYSQPGRGGGWRLLGGGRTDLSGLSAPEVRALFLLTGQQSTSSPDVRAALRKLVRALPEPFREQAERASTALVIDPTGWWRTAGPGEAALDNPPALAAVQEAVVAGQRIEIGYVARDLAASTRVVDPLGLATKGRRWYLIADTAAGMRTFRVDRIATVEITGEPAQRPDGFDLATTWQLISDEVQERRLPFRAVGRAERSIIGYLRFTLGEGLQIGPPSDDGWISVSLRGPSARALAMQVAGFGSSIVIDEPSELIERIVAIGHEIGALYR